ncbi:tRNA lysidine(34) synthetase TilS [Undibacterium cyanobacteriorum]|uniref:tRNA(Ile)-lysidine synthase n=1 Tax=Undibacterium cyanobacteriorum TaxID=3073561 RepID=A0ABY9RM74_9BURK|nr:tRNA lysidine(34) synthetase TilS [Undibacterium sp. 20NA77.5]WMW82311.1 tRNA lysidine(34) synthetase TilS [Undibacterium sp. 20NA77.5]
MSQKLNDTIAAFERRFFYQLSQTLKKHHDPDGADLGSIAVAYSGGLDSTALVHLVARFAQEHKIMWFCVHVHHGLSPHADQWLQHCQQTCNELKCDFESVRVLVQANGEGIEASARTARYRAIGEVCQRRGAKVVLTAHHIDDQAETVLMQLMRGSGVRGLAGMEFENKAPKLLGCESLTIARPLLGETRELLENYCASLKLSNVEDESNRDVRFVRNAVRAKIIPEFEDISHGFAERVARTACHMREANLLLEELAAEDLLTSSLDDGGLALSHIARFSLPRRRNLFRYWMARNGLQMPTTMKLDEIMRQLIEAKEDARIQVHHNGVMFSRYQDRLYVVLNAPSVAGESATLEVVSIVWAGEPSIELPGFSGKLYFKNADIGVAHSKLLGQRLECRHRGTGERLRLGKNRPSRDMKSHFQSAGIPFWRRDQVPFIYLNAKLLFVGELGMEAEFLDESAGQKIQLEWRSN